MNRRTLRMHRRVGREVHACNARTHSNWEDAALELNAIIVANHHHCTIAPLHLLLSTSA